MPMGSAKSKWPGTNRPWISPWVQSLGAPLLEFINHADRDHVNVAFAGRVAVAEFAVTIKIAPDRELRGEAVGDTDAEGRLHFGRLIGCTSVANASVCLHCCVDDAEPAQQRKLVAERQHAGGDNNQTARLKGGRNVIPHERARKRRLAKIHVRAFDGKIPVERVTASKLYACTGVLDRRIGEPGGVGSILVELRLSNHTDQIAAGVGSECRDRDRERSHKHQDSSLCHLFPPLLLIKDRKLARSRIAKQRDPRCPCSASGDYHSSGIAYSGAGCPYN